ncbi:MAG: 50S ribosomal protein L22 [Mycoplasmataceae bacterium]|jgi:ribosomal protein L22|nr:50S ribosomal protein L22 [Mycoplasmataceae bacterium]
MKSFVIQKQIAISPRKLGLICDLVRGKTVMQAQTILLNLDKKGAPIVLKLLNSAVANGTNNFGMNIANEYILDILANQGTIVKRTMPKAKGSASLLRKRHSHLSITVSDDINDKLSLHKKPNGKTKVAKKVIKTATTHKTQVIKHKELPEIKTSKKTIEAVPVKEEIKIAANIEKEEEGGNK